MATAFAATGTINRGNLGPKLKIKSYTLQMPSSFTAAGESWDVSSDFAVVTGYTFGPSNAITDFGLGIYNIIGTDATGGGVTGSTVKVVAHRTGAAADAVFNAANATDFSGADKLNVTLFGYES